MEEYVSVFPVGRLVLNQRDLPYSCEYVAAQLKNQINALPYPLHTVRRAQSPSTSPGYLWILSGTPPANAPATNDAVYAIDPSTLQTVGTISTPGPIPLGIAVNNGGTYAYAAIQGVAAGQTGIPAHPPLIEVIDTSALAIAQTINLPQGVNPGPPAFSPDDRYLYVPSNGTTTGLLVIDTQNPSSITTIPITSVDRNGNAFPNPVNQAAITPDGQLLFVYEANSFPGNRLCHRHDDQGAGWTGYAAGPAERRYCRPGDRPHRRPCLRRRQWRIGGPQHVHRLSDGFQHSHARPDRQRHDKARCGSE